jgi:hypothetical protein
LQLYFPSRLPIRPTAFQDILSVDGLPHACTEV